MKRIIKDMGLWLTKKRLSEKDLVPVRIKINKSKLSYFNLSTNSVVSFEHQGQLCYFRECPKLLPKNEFFVKAAEDFFATLGSFGISKAHFGQEIPIEINFSPLAVADFKGYINKKLCQKSFVKLLAKADRISEKQGFSIWNGEEYGRELLGHFSMEDVPADGEGIAIYYLWCMRSAAMNCRTQSIVKSKTHACFNAVRSFASYLLAKELGLERLLTRAEWCVIETEDGKTAFGLLSESAPGSRMADSVISPDGDLQNQLLKLNALDVICYQPDHGPNNYNVATEGDRCSICAFDNDNPNTLFPVPFVSASLSGCSPLVGKDGRVNRPYFDKATAQRINALNVKELKQKLKPYLNRLQLLALASRIKKLNRAINKTRGECNAFLLEEREFNSKTVTDELGGDFGTTYLSKAQNRT